jgi:hypothetical protein
MTDLTFDPAALDLERIECEIEQCAPEFEGRDRPYNQGGLTLAMISRDLLAEVKRRGDALAAAREELAEMRVELDNAHVHLTKRANQVNGLRAELGNAKARISAAVNVQVWTNEDGKRFVFADDLLSALDPQPAAVPGDGEQAATTCTCPPKTNNQKDPTIMQVEFTPAYLLGAWQEDPDCPQHGDAALPTSRQA